MQFLEIGGPVSRFFAFKAVVLKMKITPLAPRRHRSCTYIPKARLPLPS